MTYFLYPLTGSKELNALMIDLHCHSQLSDGELTPVDLLKQALHANVKLFALTDHDTMAGLQELFEAAQNHPIKIISGIEVSVRWKKYDIHVLGLGIAMDDLCFNQFIAEQNQKRIQRGIDISNQLKRLGVTDAYEKACAIAGHERVGRPHFAELLVNAGLSKDKQAAFKHYLGLGRSAYIPSNWADLETAVTQIKKAGGIAVIAHPMKYRLTRTKLHELILLFKSVGGVGIEVVSGAMTQAEIHEAAGLCHRFDLKASVGSDYHGSVSKVGLGQQHQLPLNCTPVWHQWTI